jgi:colanic acid/amylovoran biosynthesis glycosyltransferase
MLRIAYLISRYPALSHTFILREVLELRNRGIEIETASVNAPDRPIADLGPEEQAEALKTFVLKRQSVKQLIGAFLVTLWMRPLGLIGGFRLALGLSGYNPKKILKRFCYLLEAIVVGHWMRTRSIQHLHVHFATPAATIALLTREVFGIEFSMTVHGPDEFYEVSEYHLVEKIEAASFICTISHYCRSQLMKLSDPRHWNKIELSPLGVDPEKFRRNRTRNSHAEIQILCIGRLVPAKGQAILVEAALLLKKKGLPVRVTFAGDGPDRMRLEAAIYQAGMEEDCRFLGGVNPEKVRELYEEADLFVLPSFAEGIPVVLMEAMSMELPCITTMITGIPELIESGKQGLLVAPSDAAGLANAIQKLWEEPALRKELAVAGRRKVQRAFNLKPNVAKLEAIFQSRVRRKA